MILQICGEKKERKAYNQLMLATDFSCVPMGFMKLVFA